MPGPQSIERVAKRFKSKIESIFGLAIGKSLGHGHWGVVYETSDPTKVIKFSVDPTEGPVWKILMDRGLDRLHGMATCYSVSRLPVAYSWRKKSLSIWIILRENITPIKPTFYASSLSQDHDQRGKYLAQKAIVKYLEASRDFVRFKTPYKRQRAEEEMNYSISEMYSHQPSYYIAEAIESIYRETDIVLADVHLNNIGYRTFDLNEKYASDKEWVIFDSGHSKLTEYPQIMDLFPMDTMLKAASNIGTV